MDEIEKLLQDAKELEIRLEKYLESNKPKLSKAWLKGQITILSILAWIENITEENNGS